MHVGITAATVQRFANICRPQDVLGTLVSFLILNIAFAALEVFTGESLKTVIIETLRFNAIYVLPRNYLQAHISCSQRSFKRLFTTSTSAIAEFQLPSG